MFGAHDLRCTAASIIISAGTSPKHVQLILDYFSMKMILDAYSVLFDGDINRLTDNIDGLVSKDGGEMIDCARLEGNIIGL